jgi:hypothetical protein
MKLRNTQPSVRISLKKNRAIYISKSTLRSLDNPQYIQLLYVEGKHLLMVSGSHAKVRDSVAVPAKKYIGTDDEFAICRKILTEALRLRLGWEEGKSYRVNGNFSQNLGMVVFELEKAFKIGSEAPRHLD